MWLTETMGKLSSFANTFCNGCLEAGSFSFFLSHIPCHSWCLILAILHCCAYSILMESYLLSFYKSMTALRERTENSNKILIAQQEKKRKKLFQFHFVLTLIFLKVSCQLEIVMLQGRLNSLSNVYLVISASVLAWGNAGECWYWFTERQN